MTATSEKAIPFRVRGRIQTTTHVLQPEAFRIFQNPRVALFVDEVQERSLRLSIVNTLPHCRTIELFTRTAHTSFTGFLIGLNVASLGHFLWTRAAESPHSYELLDPRGQTTHRFVQRSEHVSTNSKVLDDNVVRRAFLLWLAFAAERDRSVLVEYEKALVHLDLAHYGVDFMREAFLNFYRAFEMSIFLRIRLGKRAKNELRAMKESLLSIGLGSEVVSELDGLYRIRGEQVSHAQRTQRPLASEDVFKMKIFTDAVIHQVHRTQMEAADAGMRKVIDEKV